MGLNTENVLIKANTWLGNEIILLFFKVSPRVEKTKVFKKVWIMKKHCFLSRRKETALFSPYFHYEILNSTLNFARTFLYFSTLIQTKHQRNETWMLQVEATYLGSSFREVLWR